MKYLKEIRFRLTTEEKTALSRIAEEKDMSQSAFVRNLLHNEARKHGLLTQSTKRTKAGVRVAKISR